MFTSPEYWSHFIPPKCRDVLEQFQIFEFVLRYVLEISSQNLKALRNFNL